MGSKRIILIAIAITVAFICLGIIGVRTFVHAVYTERGCDWSNIDNIEMHARIDIPSIEGCDCDYTVENNVKRAVFTLDKDTEMTAYATQQKLVFAKPPFAAEFSEMPGFAANKPLLVREGKNYDSDYRVALDAPARKMWVYIRYKN